MSAPSYPPGQAGPSRVAIPRLPARKDDDRASKTRVARACINCRARKIKCDGVEPRCKNCKNNEQPCVYTQSRRDRLKTATSQNIDILNFLHDLRTRVASEDRRRIESLLGEVGEDVSEAASSLKLSPSKRRNSPEGDEMDELHGEADVDAEVGSNEDVDILDEDLLQDNPATKATGYVGKSSELQWLRHLQQEIAHPEDFENKPGPYGPPGDSSEAASHRRQAFSQRRELRLTAPLAVSNSTYYLDIEDVQPNLLVDEYGMPTEELAMKLIDTYMRTVHDSFPIFSSQTVINQLQRYYTAQREGRVVTPPDKWRALINMVFAIAAYNSHLVEADWKADARDHYIYHSRARVLARSETALTAHPDLHQIQITALFSLYYMCIGHVSRAWVLIGVSLRYAYALGLHVRNEDQSASALKREILVRIWWGLYTLERNLSTLAGRPSVVMDFYCSVPLPLPLRSEQLTDEVVTHELERQFRVYTNTTSWQTPSDSSATPSSSMGTPIALDPEPANSGTYLKTRVAIGRICHKVMIDLYSAGIVMKSWENVQQTIVGLLEELERWASLLPPGLDFAQGNDDAFMRRERFILNLDFLRLKIHITRPCLCRLDRRISKQSKASIGFNNHMALACVNAAISLERSLPDPIDPVRLYQIGPWWCIIHNIMQGLAVLLLEMTYETLHEDLNRQRILTSVKKFVRWLRAMSGNNRVASNAYILAFRILQDLAPLVKADISDLTEEDAVHFTSHSEPNWEEPSSFIHATEQGLPQARQTQQYHESFSLPVAPLQENPFQYDARTTFPLDIQQQSDPSLEFLDLSGADYESMLSSDPLMYTNPFMTTFDEHNPIPAASPNFQYSNPFPDLDTVMPDATMRQRPDKKH